MALFTKPIETALKARDTANTEAQEWDAKAAAMRAEADQLDASANAAILEDETAAERITAQVLTLQRKADAFDQAAREARAKAAASTRDALSVEADELDKEADKKRREASKIDAEVDKLRAKLEEYDECRYVRWVEEKDWDSVEGRYRTTITFRGKSFAIKREARHLALQAQVIRYWLSEGTLPTSLKDLNDKFGANHDVSLSWRDGAPITRYGEPITDGLREAMANTVGSEEG